MQAPSVEHHAVAKLVVMNVPVRGLHLVRAEPESEYFKLFVMAAPTIEDTGLPRDLCWLIKKMDYEWPKIEGWFTEGVCMGLVKRGSCKILTPNATIDDYDGYYRCEYERLDENTEYEILVQNRRPTDVILRLDYHDKSAVQIPAWSEHRIAIKLAYNYFQSLHVEAMTKPNRWKKLPNTTVHFSLHSKSYQRNRLQEQVQSAKNDVQWTQRQLVEKQDSARWYRSSIEDALSRWQRAVDDLEAAEKALANFS
jgi:hypothetical protein